MSRTNALELRDALLGALLEPVEPSREPPQLLSLHHETALLSGASPEDRLLLVPLEDHQLPDAAALEARLTGALDRADLGAAGRSSIVHVVLLGGPPLLRTWLEARPLDESPLRPRLMLHHVDARFDAWHEDAPLPVLEPALATVRLVERATGSWTEGHLEALRRVRRQAHLDRARFLEILQRPAPASRAIVAAIGLVFLLQLYFGGGNPASLLLLILMGSANGVMVTEGDHWRLLSSAFLHGGVLHVVFNLIVLIQLGPFLERVIGSRRFLILYTLAAAGGGVAAAVTHPLTNMVGASSALWGLMGAALTISWRPRGLLPESLAPALKRGLGQALLLNLIISFLPGISLAAHLGGGVTGALLVLTGVLRRPVRDPAGGAASEREELAAESGQPPAAVVGSAALTVTAADMVTLLAGSILTALVHGRPWRLLADPEPTRTRLPGQAVSLEVPRSLVDRYGIQEEADGTFLIGRPGADPVVVGISVLELEGPVPVDDAAGLLMGQAGGYGLEGIGRIETVDGVPVLVDLKEGQAPAEATRWLFIREDRVVFVEAPIYPGLPAAWNDARLRVARSVLVEPTKPVDFQHVAETASIPELMVAARAALRADEAPVAKGLLERVVARDPNHREAWNELGRVHSRQGDLEQAVASFRKQLEMSPLHLEAWHNLGRALEQRGDLEGAIAAFRRETEIDPRQAGVRSALAKLYLEQGRTDEAIRELEEAAAFSPRNPYLLIELGGAYLKQGRTSTGEEAITKAVELAPFPTMWNNAAYTLALGGANLERAEDYAVRAVDASLRGLEGMTPDRVTATDLDRMVGLARQWDTLGTVYLKQGQLERAEPLLTAAWQLDQDGEVGEHLGEAYERLGERARALELYAMSLATRRAPKGLEARLSALAGDPARLAAAKERGKEQLASSGRFRIERPVAGAAEAAEAEFLVVLSPGPKVERVKLIDGDQGLRGAAERLRELPWADTFVDRRPAYLVRRGRMRCEAGAKECIFELQTVSEAALGPLGGG